MLGCNWWLFFPPCHTVSGWYVLTGRKLGQAVTTTTSTSSHHRPVLEWNVEPRHAQGWGSSSANINTFMSLLLPLWVPCMSLYYSYQRWAKAGRKLCRKSGGAIARRSWEKTLILHFLYWNNTNGYSSFIFLFVLILFSSFLSLTKVQAMYVNVWPS